MKILLNLWLICSLICNANNDCAKPKLLIKFPTRERASHFFEVLDLYYAKLSGEIPYHFVISGDLDDTGPNGLYRPACLTKLANYPNLSFYFAPRVSKVEAVNRDIDKHLDFDILLVASDDMIPVQNNYDQIITDTMLQNFPDLDGTLNFNDGYVGQNLNTIPIMGKKYYTRFNYVYHPTYLSICCDLDFTLMARMQGKEAYSDQIIIKHEHGSYGFKKDALFRHNESRTYYEHDRNILQRRKAANFDLALEAVLPQYYLSSSLDLFNYKNTPVKLSILITTIDKRQEQFATLYRKLMDQIQGNRLEHQVEVLFFKDNQTHKVGYKRNCLIENAKGEYVCFLDDDDDIHEKYVKLIYEALKSKPDCVSCTGIMYKPNQAPQKFVHSLKYHGAFVENNVACSPVYHLNPVKREYALQAKFPEQNYNEDTTWARRLYDLQLLKTEVEINEPYYFYHHDYNKSEAVPECAKKDRRIRWNPQGMLIRVHE